MTKSRNSDAVEVKFKDDLDDLKEFFSLMYDYEKGKDIGDLSKNDIEQVKEYIKEILMKPRDKEGNTLLHLAVKENNSKVVGMICAGRPTQVIKNNLALASERGTPIDMVPTPQRNYKNPVYDALMVFTETTQELFNRMLANAIDDLQNGDIKAFNSDKKDILEIIQIASLENSKIDMTVFNPELKTSVLDKALSDPKFKPMVDFLTQECGVKPTAAQQKIIDAHAKNKALFSHAADAANLTVAAKRAMFGAADMIKKMAESTGNTPVDAARSAKAAAKEFKPADPKPVVTATNINSGKSKIDNNSKIELTNVDPAKSGPSRRGR